MKTFNFNSDNGENCPICGKSTPEEAVLLPVLDPNEEMPKAGATIEAVQVHTKCLMDKSSFLIPEKEGAYIITSAKYYEKTGGESKG